MPRLLRCPKGHEWEAVADTGSATSLKEQVCPVCGAAMPAETGITPQFLDELPPPPRAESPPHGGSTPRPAESESQKQLAEPPQIPGYEIEGELGHGGMGVVYQARQLMLNRRVALKMIASASASRPDEVSRFRREAESAAQLQHPNIVQIYEVGQQGRNPFLVLEYVAGGSLAQQLAGQPQPPRKAAELVQTLARAMHVAHGRGIVHRDLKPANVLVGADGTPKITDFGLAKRLDDEVGQTKSGVVMGTPSYMAPEQARGQIQEISPVTDVYALGALLYEMLTGRPPFRAPTSVDTVHQVLFDDVVPPARLQPNLPRDLETICLKCLEKEPKRRYASALELAEELRRFLAREPILAKPSSVWQRGVKWARRRPALASLVGVSATAVLTLTVVMVLYNLQLKKERDDARQARALAQANFDRAREAVDRFYTKVTESKLLNVPRLEPLKKDLLQTAGQFYEEMVRERSDDPQVQADLGRAYWRFANITGETESKQKAVELLEKAVPIQQKLAADDPNSAEAQNNLAATYNTLGAFYHDLGKTQMAESLLKQGAEIREKLSLDHPDVPEYANNLAASRHNLGLWYSAAGSMAQAESSWKDAVAIREQLVRQYPDAVAYQSDLAQSYQVLGLLYHTTSQPAKAESVWKQGAKIEEQLVARHPRVAEYQHQLARTYNNLGGVYYRLQRMGDIEGVWLKAQALRQNLARDYPDVLLYQADLAALLMNLGSLYMALGQNAKALDDYQQARAIHEKLCRDHPSDLSYQTDKAACYNNLLALYSAMGEPDQADKICTSALDLREQLVREHPDMLEFRVGLGSVQSNKGHLVRLRGKDVDALAWYDRSMATLATVLAKNPRHEEARSVLRESHAGRATVLAKLGRYPEAMAAWDKAIEFDPGPGREQLRESRLYAMARSGDHIQAAREAEQLAKETKSARIVYSAAEIHALAAAAARKDQKLDASTQDQFVQQYGARAVEFLHKAQAAGYFDTPQKLEDLLKEPDVEALRSREDFKEFLAALREKMKTKPK
jgi:serine/threonine protein kinase